MDFLIGASIFDLRFSCSNYPVNLNCINHNFELTNLASKYLLISEFTTLNKISIPKTLSKDITLQRQSRSMLTKPLKKTNLNYNFV